MIHVLAVRGRNIRSAVEEIYSNKKRFDDITNHRIFQTVDKLGGEYPKVCVNLQTDVR